MTTLATLKADIADATDRSDTSAHIARWVRLTEAAIARDLRVHEMEAYAQLPVVQGQAALPDNALDLLNIEYGARDLQPLARNALDGMPDRSGQPTGYALQGAQLLLYPSPSNGVLEVRFRARPNALVEDTDTHPLLSTYPDIYLAAALHHAFAHYFEPERAASQLATYKLAVADANRASRKRRPISAALARQNATRVAHRR